MKLRLFEYSLRALICLCAVAPLASAQSSASDKATAEALFNEGATLVAKGSYAEGCSKFEGSQELEPTLGTELHLANCYQHLGRTASAWALFKEGQGLARRQGDSEREEVARQRAEALVPNLSYLTIAFDGVPPTALAVSRNGRDVPLASLGVAIPVDPGPQRVTASAPTFRPWAGRIEIPPGPSSIHVLIPALAPSPQPLAVAPRRTPPVAAEAETSHQRGWGIAASAVGAAALLTGGGLGLWARHDYDRSRLDRYCPTDAHNGCTSDGLALRERAQTMASASTILFLAGGASLVTGIVLWSTAPSGGADRSSRTAQLGATATPSSLGTTFEATW